MLASADYAALTVCADPTSMTLRSTRRSSYEGIFNERIAAKRAGSKTAANTLKIVLNGLFGKLGNVWSLFDLQPGVEHVCPVEELLKDFD